MEKDVKWFKNSQEAREHYIGESRSHGVLFEPKEVETPEPKEEKKKTNSKKKKADKDE